MQYKIGIGYDIHRLVGGRKLILGGINIPYPKGLLGHSDADVLLHAICDAILGAAGLPDIGQLFPNDDPKYHNISSKELLKSVSKLMRKNKYSVNNIDTVIIADAPKIAPFKKKMIANIAGILKVKSACVNIKATTQEGLGVIGEGKAIAGYAVVLLESK